MIRSPLTLTYFLLSLAISLGIEVDNVFIENQIVPDIITTAPKKLLSVYYISSNKKADLGNELLPSEVSSVPIISFPAEEKYYTLMMVDPDAPSRENPTSREYMHWLVGNMPEDVVEDGEVLIPYIGSAPPEDSGLHRYVFLVFEQMEKIDFGAPSERPKFSAQKFAEEYKLGDPLYGNFFFAQYEKWTKNGDTTEI